MENDDAYYMFRSYNNSSKPVTDEEDELLLKRN